ncbi:MAG TPA: globin family protein [Holophagaceae bacterium]|nr:globin family protein [Holophagaceae bacterium]
MITREQKQLVQTSWAMVQPIRDAAAGLFYEALFHRDPSLRALFPPDLEDQKRKLMTAVNAAVASLDDLDRLGPVLAEMGRRHVAYGVEDRHYDTVGAALLWTLEKGLGPAWAPEVEAAWEAVYALIADTMKAGAAACA